MRTARTLIRLGGCPVWSESSLAAHVILLVLSCTGSFTIIWSATTEMGIYRHIWTAKDQISLHFRAVCSRPFSFQPNILQYLAGKEEPKRACLVWFSIQPYSCPKWAATYENVPATCTPSVILICLRVRAVWSKSLLGAFSMAKDTKFLDADKEVSN